MIRHTEHTRTTRLADARGCLAAFGGLFVLSGLTALVLGLSEPGLGGLERLAVVGIGAAHLAGGLSISLSPSRAAEADDGGVTVSDRRWLRPPTTRRVSEREVASVLLMEGRDSDGDATFAPALRLATGETVPLTTQSVSSREAALAMAAAVARRIGRPEAVGW